MTTGGLPEDWNTWTIEKREIFIDELKFNWRNWARPNQLPPEDDWDIWLLLAGRGFGKLAALTTPLLTTSGWSTMGDIRLGDYVFGPDGNPTMVIGVYDVEEHDEYVVKFSDGAEVSVSDTHEWKTLTTRDRKNLPTTPGQWWRNQTSITTQDILNTLTTGSDRRDRNHCIPLTPPINPGVPPIGSIDAYTLGAWLGDGSTGSGGFTQVESDMGEIRKWIPYEVTKQAAENAWYIKGLIHDLRTEGVLNQKHIPDHWILAPYESRLALIQGLMDTDGSSVPTSNSVEFCTVVPELAEGVMQILWSLGQKPVGKWSPSYITNSDGSRDRKQDRFRITFTPTIQVFRLPRKADQLSFNGPQSRRNHHRMVRDVVQTGRKIPMRCIKVAHESSLFLIGRELISTSNTRTGAEYMKERMLAEPGCRIGIIGQTIGAARDICVEGESGLLAVINPKLVLKYNRSLGQLKLKNGSMAFTFSGGDPEKLRGFQSHYLWFDELCAMQYASATYDMALMGMRLGRNPRMVITTTPKPTQLIIELVNRSRSEPDRVRITTGSTFDNAANLAASTLNSLRARYEGTTMGRQELYAELILEEPGALWKRDKIDANRITDPDKMPKITDMAEIVVGVDPNMSQTTERATECGIIVAGRGHDGHGYLWHDASLLKPSPDAWATQVVAKYHEYSANQVVAEVNQGYDLVTHTIHTVDEKVPVKKVYSVRGKMLRAEPIAALAEQGRIHHIGVFQEVEDQMVQWVPGNASPDRLDAYVHAFTKLMLGGGLAEFFSPSMEPRLPSIYR